MSTKFFLNKTWNTYMLEHYAAIEIMQKYVPKCSSKYYKTLASLLVILVKNL